MQSFPVGLYIHTPWCIKKCPYCDFNSHVSKQALPEKDYIDALLEDLTQDIQQFGERTLSSIFIGGGTPSLLSPQSYQRLLKSVAEKLPTLKHLEVTLEANPGTFEQQKFAGYLEAGINRLSLGVQSFQQKSLEHLGRIHNATESLAAIETLIALGYENFNLDLMYASPFQSVEAALEDLAQAIALQPTHLSWYQFTLEPNTYFYRFPPPLPCEDDIAIIEERGMQLLKQAGYQRYEISAFSKPHRECQHNLNYWQFGDYYGIGAGAHGKLTHYETTEIMRTQKHRLPQAYLDKDKTFLVEKKTLSLQEKVFEFVLNTSRLESPILFSWFTEKTGLSLDHLTHFLHEASEKQLIVCSEHAWQVTELGRRFTNDLQLISYSALAPE